MRPDASRRYPHSDDPVEQEAARFLLSDFTSEKGHDASDDDHLHARPVIQGIDDKARLHTWIEIAKEYPGRVAKADRDALRQRLRELSVDEDVEFTRAVKMDGDSSPADAVADGGAVVEAKSADDGSDDDGDGEWEIGPDQAAMEYEDEAAFQSKQDDKQRVVQDLVTTVEEAEAALDREYSKDVVPIHLTDLLQDRLAELRGETDGE